MWYFKKILKGWVNLKYEMQKFFFLLQARSKAEITGGAEQIDLVNPLVKIQTLTNKPYSKNPHIRT